MTATADHSADLRATSPGPGDTTPTITLQTDKRRLERIMVNLVENSLHHGAPPVEVELYEYFKKLRSPFHAYEAEDPKSLALAIDDINKKEKKPIRYFEEIPGTDYSQHCYLLAALMIALLLGVKYLEVRTWH